MLFYRLMSSIRNATSLQLITGWFGFLQNKKTRWIEDPKLASELLAATADKGDFIEKWVAMPAWKPILSLESVNGEQWARMKKEFYVLAQHLRPVEELEAIAKELTLTAINSNDTIGSKTVSLLAFKAMTIWLFDVEFKDEWMFLLDAVEEWRMEIAMKGQGDVALKNKVIDWLLDVLESSRYNKLYPADYWKEPEHYSLFLQPFLISPSINVADIGITIHRNPGLYHRDKITDLITFSHPFPVLERFFPEGHRDKSGAVVVEPNTQVFFDMNVQKGKWAAFSLGSRACAGRKIAISLIAGIFEPITDSALHKFHPAHMYSGRDNDNNDNLATVIYQVRRLAAISLGIFCEMAGLIWAKYSGGKDI